MRSFLNKCMMRTLTAGLLCLLLLCDVTPAFAATVGAQDPQAATVSSEPAGENGSADLTNLVPETTIGTDSAGTDAAGTDAVGTGAIETYGTDNAVNAGEAAEGLKGTGAETYSDMKADTWTPEEGLPAVSGVSLYIVNKTQLLVNWKASNVFDGYQISYARNILFLRSKEKEITDSTANNLTLDGLDTTKKYYVRVRGYHMYEGDLYYTDWTRVETDKNSADASIKYMKTGGKKVDIRKQAGKKLRYYSISQGSCSDGTFLYMAFERRNGDSNGSGRARVKIAKVRISNWKLVKVSSSGQKLGHANDITYNSNQKILVVTGAKTKDPYVRIVSPKTLKRTAVKKVQLDEEYKSVKAFNGIDYDPESRTYCIRSRLYGGKTFTLDEEFRMMDVSILSTVFPSRHVQSCTSTSECFLIPQSWYQSTSKNTVTIFLKTGEKLQHIKLKLSGELESLFFIGEKLYATVHKHVKRGYTTGYIFEILL